MAAKQMKTIVVPWDKGVAYLRPKFGRYHMDVLPNGATRIRRSTKEADPVKARRVIEKLLGQITRGEFVPDQDETTVSEMLDEYLDLMGAGLSPGTIRNYQGYAKNFLIPFFGARKPKDITPQLLIDYRSWRIKQPRKIGLNRNGENLNPSLGNVQHQTVDRELSFLRSVFNWKHGINRSVVPEVPRFDMMNIDNRRTGFFGLDDFRDRLLPVLPFHLKALACCAMMFGGRKREWLSLDWDDVDFEAGVIHFDEAKAKVPREVPILPGLMEDLLKKQKAIHDLHCTAQRAVFTYEGRRLSEFKRAWKTALRTAGLQGRLFHDLRRSANKLMRDAGVPQAQRMDTMGHATASMDKRYGVRSKEDLDVTREAMKRHLAGKK